MKKNIISLLLMILFLVTATAQGKDKNNPGAVAEYKFTPVVEVKNTSVKDQSQTSTCWSFGTTSFIESELLRLGKGEYDLSEMWIIRYNYIERLRDNYRKEGKGNLGEGGLAHDWMIEFSEHGIVPDEVYTGLNYSLPRHNHSELNSLVNAISGVPLKKERESDQYLSVIDAVLDTYLGKVPETFTYKGIGYTPLSFAKSLGINASDYIEITSFSFIPFYKKGLLTIPDNWRKVDFYNVPVDDLISIMDNALNNGYTVNWDGDVSEKGFSHSMGVAVMPEVDKAEMKVTQETRDNGFKDKTTTDDHTMHITGISKDQAGNKYYITKNSWGPSSNSSGGYLNMSENYVRAKTIFIMVHKDAIPEETGRKLGIKN